MHKLIQIILIEVLLFCSLLKYAFSQEKSINNSFVINGKISGRDSGFIFLSYNTASRGYIEDSAKIINGFFKFTGTISYPHAAILRIDKTKEMIDGVNFKQLFIEYGRMDLKLRINEIGSARLSGSKSQKQFESLLNSQKDIRIKMSLLNNKLNSFKDSISKYPDNLNYKDSLEKNNKQWYAFYNLLIKSDLAFIRTHPNSFVSSYLLLNSTGWAPDDSISVLYSKLSNDVKNSIYGKKVGERVNGMPGKLAADFSAQDINGKLIELSAFKNKKYILLDFWATWCVPCRKEFPHLIELFEKYNSAGLEIISIANDNNNISGWKKVVQEEKIFAWYNLLQGTGEKNIGNKYGITPIPAKILIDKTGRIIFRSEGSDNTLLNSKLAEIFGY
jgi:thiol-disulfide isomerase/thioredoxin